MKIYQIHQTGGSYEDYYDFIIASYLSKEKAKKHLNNLENIKQAKLEKEEKCNKCPLNVHYEIEYNKDNYKEKLKMLFPWFESYCDNIKIEFDGDYILCENCSHYDEPEGYEIKEVDVIE